MFNNHEKVPMNSWHKNEPDAYFQPFYHATEKPSRKISLIIEFLTHDHYKIGFLKFANFATAYCKNN